MSFRRQDDTLDLPDEGFCRSKMEETLDLADRGLKKAMQSSERLVCNYVRTNTVNDCVKSHLKFGSDNQKKFASVPAVFSSLVESCDVLVWSDKP